MTSLSRAALLLFACFTGVVQAKVDDPPKKGGAKVEFRGAQNEPSEGLTEATDDSAKDKVYLHKAVELTNDDIAEVRATKDNLDMPAIEFIFTKEGAKKFTKLTELQTGKLVAVLVDGKVISAPLVKEKITKDRVTIVGRFTKEEVDKLVKGINGK